MTLRIDASFDVSHSAMGCRKVPWNRRYTSHPGCSVLVVQCTENLYSSWEVWCAIYHRGACFQLFASVWRFEMREDRSHLIRKWCIRVWIEPNAMIGQLVKTWLLIGCGITHLRETRKGHTCNQLLAHLMPKCMHRIENLKKIRKIRGVLRGSIVCSSVVQSTWSW